MAEQKRPRPVIDDKVCIGCAMCLENCPRGCLALEMPAREDAIQEVAVLREPEKCIGCNLCYKACPADAITGEVRKAHTIDQTKCIKCGQCKENCRFGAIEFK